MTNLDACTRLGLTPCLGAFDGEAVHSGLETSVHLGSGPWRVGSSLSLIRARLHLLAIIKCLLKRTMMRAENK